VAKGATWSVAARRTTVLSTWQMSLRCLVSAALGMERGSARCSVAGEWRSLSCLRQTSLGGPGGAVSCTASRLRRSVPLLGATDGRRRTLTRPTKMGQQGGDARIMAGCAAQPRIATAIVGAVHLWRTSTGRRAHVVTCMGALVALLWAAPGSRRGRCRWPTRSALPAIVARSIATSSGSVGDIRMCRSIETHAAMGVCARAVALLREA